MLSAVVWLHDLVNFAQPFHTDYRVVYTNVSITFPPFIFPAAHPTQQRSYLLEALRRCHPRTISLTASAVKPYFCCAAVRLDWRRALFASRRTRADRLQEATAARWALFLRWAGVRARARATPPLRPPKRPRATAWIFLGISFLLSVTGHTRLTQRVVVPVDGFPQCQDDRLKGSFMELLSIMGRVIAT